MREKSVIFICSFNSVRSPIAEGLLRYWNNQKQYSVYSAGIAPIRVRPYTVMVMKEQNIDISNHIPASIHQFRNMHFDYVITLDDNTRRIAEQMLCDGDRYLHNSFNSPQEIGKKPEIILTEYRQLRDAIKEFLSEVFPKETPFKENSSNSSSKDYLHTILPSCGVRSK